MKTYRATLVSSAGSQPLYVRALEERQARRLVAEWRATYHWFELTELVEVSEPAEQLPLVVSAATPPPASVAG